MSTRNRNAVMLMAAPPSDDDYPGITNYLDDEGDNEDDLDDKNEPSKERALLFLIIIHGMILVALILAIIIPLIMYSCTPGPDFDHDTFPKLTTEKKTEDKTEREPEKETENKPENEREPEKEKEPKNDKKEHENEDKDHI